MSLEDQIRTAQTRISQATGRQARAEAEHDQLTSQLEQSRAALKDQFGVSTPEEARATLARLQAEVEQELTKVQKQLDEAGA